jgi:hypothetical protein
MRVRNIITVVNVVIGEVGIVLGPDPDRFVVEYCLH